ncbi:MAG: hypothetical protein EOM43_07445 [Gammaproteobacteria bacterium]|nr:hypothetical protein [Gammaproteobacteria bacterium]
MSVQVEPLTLAVTIFAPVVCVDDKAQIVVVVPPVVRMKSTLRLALTLSVTSPLTHFATTLDEVEPPLPSRVCISKGLPVMSKDEGVYTPYPSLVACPHHAGDHMGAEPVWD